MAKRDYSTVVFDDEDGNRLDVIWSRSGKRLIVSTFKTKPYEAKGQVELRADQVQELLDFLVATLPDAKP